PATETRNERLSTFASAPLILTPSSTIPALFRAPSMERLSHFRVLSKLGEGGMGVVYKAEDEELRRIVALKVLPEAYVADRDRRARFKREAQAAAAVTHPGIAAIYEIGEQDDIVFIAMEYVHGE